MGKLKLGLLLVLMFIGTVARAQDIYSLSGRVVAGNGKTISLCNMALYNAADSAMIKGSMTDNQGEFVFQGLKNGNYYLQVFFVGFERKQVDSIVISSENVVLQPVVMRRKATELEEVKVVSEKGMFESQAGKMVYNVDGNINAVGESALELMQNIPSLGTDMDDKVTLRGAKATVLIDGVESDLSSMLDQIPSDAIESIEVITNPSARYESKTGAGIVNIKLKKSAKTGYTGKVGAGFGNRDKHHGSAQLGYNLKKWKFASSVNYKKDVLEDDIQTDRESTTNGTLSFMSQDRHNTKSPVSTFFRNSANYYLDGKSFVGFQYILQDKSQQNRSEYLTEHFNSDHELTSKSSTSRDGKDHNQFHQFSTDFHKIFNGDDQHLLDLNLLYSFNKPLNEYDQLNEPITVDQGLPVTKYTTDSKNYSNQVRLLKFKADYSRAISTKWKVETGLLLSMDHYVQDLISIRSIYLRNDSTDQFDETSYEIKSSSFDYHGYAASTYGLVSGGFGKYRLSAGLRFEMSVNEATSDESTSKAFYKLIPSIHFKQVKSNIYNWEFSYTSRILPPTANQLNPISLSWGEYFKSTGNPKLSPEVFSQAEFANHWVFSKTNYSLTFFAKNRSDIIGRWYTVVQDEENKDVTYSTFENLGGVLSFGADANAMMGAGKFVFRPAFSAFFSRISGEKFGPDLDRHELSTSAKLTGDYKINKDLTVQFSGRYNSPFISEDGKRFGYYSVDAGFKANMYKRKLALSLKVVDAFDTMEYDKIVNQRLNYTSTSHVDPHNFLVYFDLSYKFNSLIKKKS
ncbi:outer membrane beta-barrel protein [Mangrovibacterium sp.]|uniref:outer membrane beta-barrel protein n=1 Tax=Mangrovibacterium sp. TaxID=1961364 RepID=UPI0035649E5F